jgi:anti-sigma factor RsiW
MSRFAHIEFATLVELGEGRLDPAASADVQAHLATCPRCAEQAARLAEVIGLMRADAGEDAPRYALVNARNLFRARRQPSVSPLRRVLAALKFDSLQMSPAMGVRAAAAGARQLLFSAGDNELHLQVAPLGEAWQVTGQVLGPCSGGDVEMRGDAGNVHAALNELCEFALPPLADGEYTLTLHLGQVDLEIPELKLGEPKA